MENKLILILMDILVLSALGATMYMMRNVSASIKIIREGKTELQQLLQQLNVYISNAQHAIDNMKNLADEKGRVIQKHIENATAATEELQYIQKAAENVAKRLEGLTMQSSEPLKQGTAPLAAKAPGNAPQRLLSKAEKELANAMAVLKSGKGKGE